MVVTIIVPRSALCDVNLTEGCNSTRPTVEMGFDQDVMYLPESDFSREACVSKSGFWLTGADKTPPALLIYRREDFTQQYRTA